MNEQTELSQEISNNYLLVDIVLRRFSGMKKDKEASAEVTSTHQAAANSAKVIKDILAGARAELKDVSAAQESIRAYLYRSTLPWSASTGGRKVGARLLPTVKSFDFLSQYRYLLVEYNTALASFLGAYSTRVQEAMANLGTLAKASDYPDMAEIQDQFGVDLDMSPVPAVTDFARMAVPVKVAEYLSERLAKRQSASMENAMQDMSDRIVSQLKRIVTQYTKVATGEKTKMFASLTDNMVGIVELLKASNFANDKGLTELADRLTELTVHDVSVVKNSVSVADTLASKAKVMLDDIEGDMYF